VKIFLIILSVFVVVLVGGGIALGPQLAVQFQGGSKEAKGLPVKLHTVSRTSLTEAVSAPGTVEPRHDVDISARFSARVKSLPFEEGDRVQPNDVVVELDAEDLMAALARERARLKSEEARLEGVRASLTVAQSRWRRQKELFETKDRPLATLEEAERDYFALKADLESAEYGLLITQATIQQREEELKYAKLRSPIEGTIVRINAEVGETVVAGTMNNLGTVILNIADFDEMLVKARIDESDIAPIAVDQIAEVHINAYPDEVFEGRVLHIGLNRLTDNTGTGYFEVEILLDTKGRQLYSGLSSNIEVQVATHEGQLTVPSQCVQERLVEELDDETIESSELIDRSKRYATLVYRFVDGEAVATAVDIGPSDLINTIIEEGLSEGDIVVSGPFKTLMSIKHEQKIHDERDDDKPKKGAAAEAATADNEATADGEVEPADDSAAEETPAGDIPADTEPAETETSDPIAEDEPDTDGSALATPRNAPERQAA
jgi:HlyD family secretion protein